MAIAVKVRSRMVLRASLEAKYRSDGSGKLKSETVKPKSGRAKPQGQENPTKIRATTVISKARVRKVSMAGSGNGSI